MRYHEITEAVDDAAERAKITAANAKASNAAQNYQRTVRQARDKANAARRRLQAPKPTAPFPGEG